MHVYNYKYTLHMIHAMTRKNYLTIIITVHSIAIFMQMA
jgi:hypothetical protein